MRFSPRGAHAAGTRDQAFHFADAFVFNFEPQKNDALVIVFKKRSYKTDLACNRIREVELVITRFEHGTPHIPSPSFKVWPFSV